MCHEAEEDRAAEHVDSQSCVERAAEFFIDLPLLEAVFNGVHKRDEKCFVEDVAGFISGLCFAKELSDGVSIFRIQQTDQFFKLHDHGVGIVFCCW